VSHRRPPPTFEVRGEDEPLRFLSVLRSLPGRRLAGRARWRGEDVFAKALLDPRRARRQRDAELRGAAILKDSGLPAPSILTTLQLEEGHLAVLFQWLEELETAVNLLRLDRPAEERADAILELSSLIGRAEGRGVILTDPHLGNFGRNEKGWWFLDAGGVQSRRRGAMTRRPEETVFSRFIAQWDPADDEHLDAAAEAWSRSSKGAVFLPQRWRNAQARQRRERLTRFDRKMLRASRRFDAPAPGLLVSSDLDPEIREPLLAWARSLDAPSSGRVRIAENLLVDVRTFDRAKDARKTWCAHQRLELFRVPHTRALLLGDRYLVERVTDDDGSFDGEALRSLLTRLRTLGADGLIHSREDIVWRDGRPILRPRPGARVGPPPPDALEATEDEARARALYDSVD